MFKVKIACALDVMKEIFEIENRNFDFQQNFLIKRHNVRSLHYGTETASFTGPKILDTLFNRCKDAISLKSFKKNLKR